MTSLTCCKLFREENFASFTTCHISAVRHQPFTHSLTHSLTSSLTLSLTHSLTHSLTPSLTPSITPSLTPSLTHSLTLSLLHSLTHSLTPSLTLTHSLTLFHFTPGSREGRQAVRGARFPLISTTFLSDHVRTIPRPSVTKCDLHICPLGRDVCDTSDLRGGSVIYVTWKKELNFPLSFRPFLILFSFSSSSSSSSPSSFRYICLPRMKS